MALQYRGQRADDVFNALVGRQQAEREQDELAFGAELVFEVVGIHEGKIRNAVRNHIDLPARNRIHFAQQLRRQFAHHNHAIGKLRNLFEHHSLVRVRLAQNRMQRGHQRHLQLS